MKKLPLLPLLLPLYLLLLPHPSHPLHSDQAGKFDWHLTLLGPIRHIWHDPLQPKRILLGAENNVVAALHSNTGTPLWRHTLEPDQNLLLFAPHPDYDSGKREAVAVSYSASNNLVKIRTFHAPSGVELKSWVFGVGSGECVPKDVSISKMGNIHFLCGVQTSEIRSFKLETGKEVKKMTVGKECRITGGSFAVCQDGLRVRVLDLDDGDKEAVGEVEGKLLHTSRGSGIGSFLVKRGDSIEGYTMLQKKLVKIEEILLTAQLISSTSDHVFTSSLTSPLSIEVKTFSKEGKLLVSNTYTSSTPLTPLLLLQPFLNPDQPTPTITGLTNSLLLFSTSPSSTTPTTLHWTREESLSSISSVEMVDFPTEEQTTFNPYSSSQQKNPLSSFLSRVKHEFEAVLAGSSLYASNDDRFGLRKVIVFLTSIGKVIGMESSTGSVIYSFVLPDFAVWREKEAFLFLQRAAKYAPLKAQAVVVYKSRSNGETVVFAFDPVEGRVVGSGGVSRFPRAKQVQLLHMASEETEWLKGVVILDERNRVHVWPMESVGVVEAARGVHFFVVEEGGGGSGGIVLKGLVVKKVEGVEGEAAGLKATPLWTLPLVTGTQQTHQKQTLLGVYPKLATERIHSQGRVLPDRSVSYKYMNPNLVVVATADKEGDGGVNLFLVDAVSGTPLHSLWHRRSRPPLHLAHSEHWIVYTLFNDKTRRLELNSIELYEGTTRQSNATAFSSFAAPPVEPIIVKQSYIFPTSSIQHLAYTRTEKGITNKDILIGLPTGGVLELPRMVVQPKVLPKGYTQAPGGGGGGIVDEDGVVHHVPYQPELPILSEMIFNYNQSVKRIEGVRTWPTRLESTCLVLVWGSDIFYTKLTPSKTFDVLKDDFDHWIITVALVGLSMAAFGARRWAGKKQLEQASWK